MKTIYFRKDTFIATPDSNIQNVVDTFINSNFSSIIVTNSLLIDAFRLAVKQNKISHEDIMIEYTHVDEVEGEIPTSLFIDKNGSLDKYPDEIYGISDKILNGLVGWE